MIDIDFKKIFKFGEMSKYAYLGEEKIKEKYSDNVVAMKNLPETDGFGYLLKDDENKIIYVIARGTFNTKNWIVDADYAKHKDEDVDIYLHKGFEKSAKEMLDHVKTFLDKYHSKGYKFNVTGHSLGGAMAAILMMYLDADGYELGETITFGQPKVTNESGVEKYRNHNILRIIDEKDLVPLVPPATLISEIHGRYRHVGPEVILLKDKYVVEMNEHDSESVDVTSFWSNIGDENVTDHFMENYLKRIELKFSGYENVPFSDKKKYEGD